MQAAGKTMQMTAAMAMVTAVVLGGANMCSAAVVAYDQASYPVYADNNPIGDNGGFGFGAWTHELSGSGGFFTTNEDRQSAVPGEPHKFPAPGLTTDGWYFALWHDGGGESVAVRPFASALNVGDSFSATLDHGWVDDGRFVGVRFRDSGGSTRLSFDFLGGSGGGYRAVGEVLQSASRGWTPEGFNLKLTLTGADAYQLTIDWLDGATDDVFTGTLAGSGGISQVAFYTGNQFGGWERDFYFNKLTLEVVPEPSSLAVLTLAALALLRRRSV